MNYLNFIFTVHLNLKLCYIMNNKLYIKRSELCCFTLLNI